MKKIGLPDDNMLLISAGRIKALILEEKALDLINEDNIFEPIGLCNIHLIFYQL